MKKRAAKALEKRQGKSRILIVDDHTLIRYALADLINQQEDLEVCAEAWDAATACAAARSQKPHLAIVDLTLTDSHGLDLIKNFKVQHPDLAILVVSMHDEMVFAESAIRAGASGYIMKEHSIGGVLGAIRKVLNGEIYVSEKFAETLLDRQLGRDAGQPQSRLQKLSDRECQILHLLGQWQTTRQISEQLNLSIKTIDHYREQIKKKLNLKHAIELMQLAVQVVSTDHQPQMKVLLTPSPEPPQARI